MKKLNNEQMENLQGGWPTASELCSAGQFMSAMALAYGLDQYIEMYTSGLNLQGGFCQ